jgi:hypothetical protein
MTCLVSLISDHVLPAYLFIKEMDGQYDRLLFVTSRRNSEHAKRIERTLGIEEGSVQRIEVADADLNSVSNALKNDGFSSDDRFIVHLPDDATMMAIGTFGYFSENCPNTSFYFVPPGENSMIDVKTSLKRSPAYQVNIEEYFSLHGIRFEYKETLTYSYDSVFELFRRLKEANFRKHKMGKYGAQITGVWFEEYTYHRIKNEKKLKDGYIHTGVKIFRSENDTANDNEIDIVYTLDNELYIGECKLSLTSVPGGKNAGNLLEEYLYKLAAISIDFGLNVRQSFITLHPLNRLNLGAVRRRMKILQLEALIGRDDFKRERLPLDFAKKLVVRKVREINHQNLKIS